MTKKVAPLVVTLSTVLQLLSPSDKKSAPMCAWGPLFPLFVHPFRFSPASSGVSFSSTLLRCGLDRKKNLGSFTKGIFVWGAGWMDLASLRVAATREATINQCAGLWICSVWGRTRRRFYSMGPQARLIPDSCLRGGRMRGDGVSYSSLFVRAFVAKADHA